MTLAGKAAAGRPVSQETEPNRQADTPSRKGVALMNRRFLLTTTGALALAAALSGVALGAGSSPPVSVRVEGVKKTLLLPTTVHAPSGWITKYGAKTGQCSAQSAQGALDAATNGKWVGKWYSSYHEYLITSILGEKSPGGSYWEIFVNNKSANVGACDIKLQRGQQLLFADTNSTTYPSQLMATVAGNTVTVKLLGYSASGSSKPLPHVQITGNGVQAVKTNSKGMAQITAKGPGTLTLRASPKGYIRSERVVQVQHPH